MNDIALIELQSKAILNEYVQLACLPNLNKTDVENSTSVTAVGWGRTSSAGSLSDVLRKVNITVYNSSACNDTNNELIKDWNSQLCAGDLNGKKDTCQGDSGGPALDDQDRVIGILSRGAEGCDFPTYVDPSFFADFIDIFNFFVKV